MDRDSIGETSTRWTSGTPHPAVVAFRDLYGDNETPMDNTSQQLVRDEMPPVIRGFDAETDGDVASLPRYEPEMPPKPPCPAPPPTRGYSYRSGEAGGVANSK